MWKNLIENSPFGNGERVGTNLTTALPIWTDQSCCSPEFASGYNVKACFNVSATLDDCLSVVCGETVAKTQNIATDRWNATAMIGCDIRFGMDSTHLIKPCSTSSYSSSQFQFWDYNTGNLGLDPQIIRSYHVRRSSSQLGIRVNDGKEILGNKSNGRTENLTSLWPIVYTNNIKIEVFCIRYYNRALTAEEIAANYATDKIRFGLP